jgi:uncharacterized protein (DUF486 family)
MGLRACSCQASSPRKTCSWAHASVYGGSPLKILQEAIALSVFVPFAVLYMKQPLKLNYVWAALCICAAVYVVFREV